jgi:hypothetical protein
MKTMDARIIRRGIEYARREIDGTTNPQTAVAQTERYVKYLSGRQQKLFTRAWARVMLDMHAPFLRYRA